jgi:hypothetical protein
MIFNTFSTSCLRLNQPAAGIGIQADYVNP